MNLLDKVVELVDENGVLQKQIYVEEFGQEHESRLELQLVVANLTLKNQMLQNTLQFIKHRKLSEVD